MQLLGNGLCTPAKGTVMASVAERSQQDTWGSWWDPEEEGEPVLLEGQGACVSLQASARGWREREPPLGGGLGPEQTRLQLGLWSSRVELGKCRWLSGLGPCFCHAGLQARDILQTPALSHWSAVLWAGFHVPRHLHGMKEVVSPAAEAS